LPNKKSRPAKGKLKKAFTGAIRKARTADLGDIVSLDKECFRPTETWPRAEWNDCIKLSTQDPDTIVLVAMDGGKMAGCVVGMIVEDGHGEIASIAVTKDYRGQGLGRVLLESVSESLCKQGADRLVLQVRPDNESAIRMYETSGFVKTALLPHYYEDGDAMEMTRSIKKPRKAPIKPSGPH